MYSFDTQYRVCYGDTDKMGVVYYGNYPRFYEIGRTDMIREIYKSYRLLEEEDKIFLPARSLHINYHKPAYYDELLTIRTVIKEMPKVKFPLISEIYNEAGELINEGKVVLAFMDFNTGRPCKIPDQFEEILRERLGE